MRDYEREKEKGRKREMEREGRRVKKGADGLLISRQIPHTALISRAFTVLFSFS